MEANFLFKQETYQIIGCAMEVHKELGYGFLEAIYQEALEIEFLNQKIPYEREAPLPVYYKDIQLEKQYYADFICFDKIIVELKSVQELNKVHLKQILNYLKATESRLGLILNFGKESLEYKRIIQ